MSPGTWADWFVAATTLLLAVIAVFQDHIRGWIFAPALRAAITTEPPDCVWVPMAALAGSTRNSVHARLLIENRGPATAVDVEVYGRQLRRLGEDGKWARVREFPPMNLTWADVGGVYMSGIAPHTAKYCDFGHIGDPVLRNFVDSEQNPNLVLRDDETAFVFATAAVPNHKGHIIPSGSYELDVVLSAKNARATLATIGISFDGRWYEEERDMITHGLYVQVVRHAQRP